METNKKMLSACLVLLCCLVAVSAVSLVKLCVLSDAVSILDDRCLELQHTVNELSSDLAALEYELEEQHREANSLFEVVEYTLVGAGSEEGTAACEFTLVPKLISEETHLMLTIGTTTYSLGRTGNAFTGTVEFPMFTEEVPYVTLTDAAGTQQQALEEVDLYWTCRDWLPSIMDSGYGATSTNEDWTQVDLTYAFVYNTEHAPVTFVKITEIHTEGGQQTRNRDITDELKNSGDPSYYEYDTGCIVKDKTVWITIRAEDSLGYIHELTSYIEPEMEGGMSETYWGGESIYAPDGTLVYGE